MCIRDRITAFLHSVGIFLSFHTWFNNLVNHLVNPSTVLNSSLFSPSYPGLFPFFSILIASFTSSISIILISSCSCLTLRGISFIPSSPSSTFNNSSKYSLHLSVPSSSSRRGSPSLFRTVCISGSLFPLMLLAIPYKSFPVPFASSFSSLPILLQVMSLLLLFTSSAWFLAFTYSILFPSVLVFIHFLYSLFLSFTAFLASSFHHAVFFFPTPSDFFLS